MSILPDYLSMEDMNSSHTDNRELRRNSLQMPVLSSYVVYARISKTKMHKEYK